MKEVGDRFDRILASLHSAALGDAEWRAASALIDEACEIVGSHLCVLDRGRMLFDEPTAGAPPDSG